MSLTEQLAGQASRSRAALPKEILAVMDAATAKVLAGGILDGALAVGDVAPSFVLPDADGGKVALSDLLATGPVVISFFRGAWCGYCNLELRALHLARDAFAQHGASLVAISPQVLDEAAGRQAREALGFPLLNDRHHEVAEQFGIVFTLTPELKTLYDSWGYALDDANVGDGDRLPLPATFVVAPDGRVTYAFVDVDYTRRADPDDLLAHLATIA